MGPLKSQNSIIITLTAEGTLLNFLVLGNDVFSLHALMFACTSGTSQPLVYIKSQLNFVVLFNNNGQK
jgi:hypothetical protein